MTWAVINFIKHQHIWYHTVYLHHVCFDFFFIFVYIPKLSDIIVQVAWMNEGFA